MTVDQKNTPNTKQMLFAMLKEWTDLAAKLATDLEKEKSLRKAIFDLAFPKPEEGVNSADLNDGWVLKGTHKINRTLDKAALPAVLEKLEEMGVCTDELVSYSPSLCVTAYKNLGGNERAVMDEVVTSKPGLPSLELVLPKRKK